MAPYKVFVHKDRKSKMAATTVFRPYGKMKKKSLETPKILIILGE